MNITAHRKSWFLVSSLLVGASLLATVFFGFNLGLDFTGGARWTVNFETQEVNPPDKGDLGGSEQPTKEEAVAEISEPVTREMVVEFFKSIETISQDPQIQTTTEGDFLITIEDMSDEELQAIATKMREQVGEFEQKSYRKVDSTIGASFKKKAVYAIFMALIGIVLFVAWAFRKIPKAVNPWRFGAVAIVALFHDIVIILGIFVTLGAFISIELDLAFITALLATLGFSVNDTIVILDRVRENIRLQKAHETFEDTIENSIQQTLHRSINTSISTLLPLLALLFFGAESIFYFVLALALGIAIGTYSSIFLAAPLLAAWKIWADGRE